MFSIKDYLGGSPKTLNKINISVVLDRIRRGENVSRSSLAKELNLSLPTISRIVDTLINQEFVVGIGYGISKGGKKPALLKFNGSKYHVIGVEIDIDFINIILSDFSGLEKKCLFKKFKKEKSPSEMLKILVKYIKRIIKDSNLDMKDIQLISIGIPGMVDSQSGKIRLCPSIPTWEGVCLADILTKRIGVNVLVDNMLNLSVLGESWKGVAKNINNVVFVGVGTGVGAGILIEGKVYRGYNGSAGEVGYMTIQKDYQKNISAPPYGQFEYLTSNIAIRRKFPKDNYDSLDIKKIETLIGKSIKKEDILEIIDSFAYGVANLITILNPELVVIRNELFYKTKELFEYFKNKVLDLIPFEANIEESILKEKVVVIGAVKYAIEFLDKRTLSPFFH